MCKRFDFFTMVFILAAMVGAAFAGKAAGGGFSCESGANQSGRILFSSSAGGSWRIWSMDGEGADLLQWPSPPQADLHYPSWSPDGEKMACASNVREIWILSPKEPPQKLSGLPADCSHPAWSPDGKHLAVVAYTYGNPGEDSDIWIADLDGGNARKLAALAHIQSFPAWSPDGGRIVFTTGYRVSSRQVVENLWSIGSDGENPRPLTTGDFQDIQPSWSPDGEKIAFASNRGGSMDIWIVDPDGRNLRRLTFAPSLEADPSWSPDGSALCFTSTNSGRMEIWRMDRDGKNLKQLTDSTGWQAESMQPSWR